MLTSGGQPTALAGASTIRAIAEQTRSHLEIMPGGGIRVDNVLEVLKRTGCDQVHVGASIAACDGSLAENPTLDLVSPQSLAGGAWRKIDAATVLELSHLLKSLNSDSSEFCAAVAESLRRR